MHRSIENFTVSTTLNFFLALLIVFTSSCIIFILSIFDFSELLLSNDGESWLVIPNPFNEQILAYSKINQHSYDQSRNSTHIESSRWKWRFDRIKEIKRRIEDCKNGSNHIENSSDPHACRSITGSFLELYTLSWFLLTSHTRIITSLITISRTSEILNIHIPNR